MKNQPFKIFCAVFLNLAMMAHSLQAELSQITFEAVEWRPFESVRKGPQTGWNVLAGDAMVSPVGEGLNGGRSLLIPANASREGLVSKEVTWDALEQTAFIDFQIKPAADTQGAFATFFANGSQLAFQVTPGSDTGVVWAYDGNDGVADPATKPERWVQTGGSFYVPKGSLEADAFMRITLRQDYQRNVWDLYVNGKMVAAKLMFEGRGSNLARLDFYGSKTGNVRVDDIAALPTNMLFVDADKDGIPDAWETGNGGSTTTHDRDAIKPGTTTSFLDAYLASLRTPGSAAPVTTGPLALTIDKEAPHQPVTSLKGSLSVGADGSASYSLPLDLPKGTGGMEPKLSLGYSSNSGNGIVGVGWNLAGLQRINRGASSTAKDGSYDPMDFDKYDRFFLDGERLVCISGTYGKDGSEYRTEIDSFARITAMGDGPISWKVQTKAGLTVILGGTANSKIALPPLSDNRVLSWSVNRVSDTVGNYYKVTYDRDDANAELDFINHRVSQIDYTGFDNGTTQKDPYCSVRFKYESRDDSSRSYTTYAGYRLSKRLAKIQMYTGDYLNHAYRLSYKKSYQTNRSLLYSVSKHINGKDNIKTEPTIFKYGGLEDPGKGSTANPLWKSPGASTLPGYGDHLDASGSVNSMITETNQGTGVNLAGDVARAYVMPTPVRIHPDTMIEFEFRSTHQSQTNDSGAFIGLDNDRTYDRSKSSALYRIGGTGSINLSNGNFIETNKNTISYTPGSGWKTFRKPIGQLGSVGSNKYLVLLCVDNNINDGIDDAFFRNVKLYRAGRNPKDVTPLSFGFKTELPRFADANDKDRGIVSADLDSDGLVDIADWCMQSFKDRDSNQVKLEPNTIGFAFRNIGGEFRSANNSLKPPGFLPLSVRKSGDTAYDYNKKFQLVAQPMDVDGDGALDLMGSVEIRSKSGFLYNEYKFYTLVNDEWVPKPGWQLPFQIRNVPSAFGSGGGSRRTEHFQWVDLNGDGYQDLSIYLTDNGRLYALDSSGNAPPDDLPSGTNPIYGDSVSNDVSAVFLNKGKDGPGWKRDHTLRLPYRLQHDGNDEGFRLLDVDGNGIPELIQSRYKNGDGLDRVFTLRKKADDEWVKGTDTPDNTSPTRWVERTNNLDYNRYRLPMGFVISNGSPTETMLLDVNGDGLSDIVNSLKNGSFVSRTWLNQGLRSNKTWSEENNNSYTFPYPLYYATGEAGPSDRRVAHGFEVADINGDGLVDVLYSDKDNEDTAGSDNVVFRNTGNGWERMVKWGLPDGHRIYTTSDERKDGDRRSKLQDVNGDGFPDLITGLLDEAPKVWFNKCKPEILESVTDGMDTTLRVEYKQLNDVNDIEEFGTRIYRKGPLPGGDPLEKGQSAVIDGRLVVSKYSSPNGNGVTRWQHQRYGDLRYDRFNEASLGFGWMETLDSLTGQVSRTEMRRDYPFAGSPSLIKVTVPVTQEDLNGGRLPGVTVGTKTLSIETFVYDQLPPINGVSAANGGSGNGAGGKVRRPVQIFASTTNYDLNLVATSSTKTTQNIEDYDEYGFVWKSVVEAADGAKVTTESIFDHYTTNDRWLLGRLRESKVTKTNYANPDLVRKSSFKYDLTNGLLEKETIEPGNAKRVVTTYLREDGYGNVTETQVESGGTTRISKSNYGTGTYAGRFLREETDALDHKMIYEYDDKRALLTSTTDIGGLKTRFGYDKFGTQIRTYHPDSTLTGESTGYSENADLPSGIRSHLGGKIKFFRAKQTSGSPVGKVYVDNLGRELCTESTILRDAASTSSTRYSKIYTLTKYDALGRKSAVSEPFAAGETPRYTRFYHDFLNRLINTAHPDETPENPQGTSEYVETFTTVQLNGKPAFKSVTHTRDGKTLERWEDQHGRLIQSRDPSNQITTFLYDGDSRLIKVAINGQTMLENTFDPVFGNKTQVKEANAGTSSSVYNGFGEVISSTNAKLQTTSFTYDLLGRPSTITRHNEGTYTTHYDGAIGNGKGDAWKTTGPGNYNEEITYDSLGRVISTTKTQYNETFISSTTYDALGRVQTETDAGGLTMVHEYDAKYSFPIRISIGVGSVGAGTELWKAGNYDTKGRPISQSLAQGVTTSASYHPTTGLLTGLCSSSAGHTDDLQKKIYTWDPLGNLKTRTSIRKSPMDGTETGKKEFFKYDGLNRLTHAHVAELTVTTPTFSGTPDFVYDTNGNLKSKPGASLIQYDGTRPHAVTSATVKGAARNYSYDAAGYVTSDDRRDYYWTSFGQLRSLNYNTAPALQDLNGLTIYDACRVTEDFYFDAAGNRARQYKERIAMDDSRVAEDTLYLGSYEREIHSTLANGGAHPVTAKIVHRHDIGGFAVYTRTTDRPDLPDEMELTTVLKDHLGSPDVLYTGTWNGSAFVNPTPEFQSFDAWGERRDAATLAVYRAAESDPMRTSTRDYDRGYTGHEQLDDSGIIHMNGRIYDPEVGRMLSPDPYVQVPEFSQNFNRYSYVLNNPLNMTDPSGFSWLSKAFHKMGSWLKQNWRAVVSIVASVALFFVLGPGAFGVTGMQLQGAQLGFAVGASSGAANAAINGGNSSDILTGAAVGGVQGGITGGVLHPMGELAAEQGFFSAETALHIAGHGVVGGAANAALGGKFQDGFISAAVSAGASDAGLLGDPDATGAGAVTSRTIRAGVLGGTVSALGGGKFANGAWTASFQHLLNDELITPEMMKNGWSYEEEINGENYTVTVGGEEPVGGAVDKARTAFGLASMIPGPIGSVAGLIEGGLAISQGDWSGAAWAIGGSAAALVGAGGVVKLAKATMAGKVVWKASLAVGGKGTTGISVGWKSLKGFRRIGIEKHTLNAIKGRGATQGRIWHIHFGAAEGAGGSTHWILNPKNWKAYGTTGGPLR